MNPTPTYALKDEFVYYYRILYRVFHDLWTILQEVIS